MSGIDSIYTRNKSNPSLNQPNKHYPSVVKGCVGRKYIKPADNIGVEYSNPWSKQVIRYITVPSSLDYRMHEIAYGVASIIGHVNI